MYSSFLIFFIFSFSFGYNSYYIFTLSRCFFLFSTRVNLYVSNSFHIILLIEPMNQSLIRIIYATYVYDKKWD